MKFIFIFLGFVGICIIMVGGGAILGKIVSHFVKEQNKDGTRLVVFILWIIACCIVFFSGSTPSLDPLFRAY
jgi:TRAP-type C4-dicarboxylate transport system permease small subunit